MEGKYDIRTVDLVIEGKCYINGNLVECALAVNDELIVSVSKPSLAPNSDKRVRVNGRYIILPGMVDMHVHMRDLGESYKEDWLSGSLSALAGGVTFVADMPNNNPFINDVEGLRFKLDRAKEKAIVDFGFYIGFPRNLGELDKANEWGVLGVKIYPNDYTRDLENLFRGCSKLNIPIIAHAEDPSILGRAYNLLEKKVSSHHLLRPEEAEIFAIKFLANIAYHTGARLHITHISTNRSLREILEYSFKGIKITCDTCPHYFFLDAELTSRYGGIAKVNPPLRPKPIPSLMRSLLSSLLFDAISTDHAPHALEEKLRERYEEVPSGFPGLETCLPLLFKLIVDENFPIRILDLYSRKPAEILCIPKGALEVNKHADFVIYDYKVRWRIMGSELYSKAKFTPFEGMEVVGKPISVYIRGALVWELGELKVSKGFGRYVSPARCSSSIIKA